MEFMLAMNEYKQQSGRMFPTWSEVLEVLRSLGYEKIPDLERQEVDLHRRTPVGRGPIGTPSNRRKSIEQVVF